MHAAREMQYVTFKNRRGNFGGEAKGAEYPGSLDEQRLSVKGY